MKLRAVIAMVALLTVPLAWAAKPGEVEPAEISMEDLLTPVKPIPASQQVLGVFRIEGLPDGTTTVSQVKAPDLYFPEGTLGSVSKALLDPYISVVPSTFTECYQTYAPPNTYSNRCESTTNSGFGNARHIILEDLQYDYPGGVGVDCDISTNLLTPLPLILSNCTVTGFAVTGGMSLNVCGNPVIHDPDQLGNGLFDIALTVQVPNLSQRFVVYISLVGPLFFDPNPCPGTGQTICLP